MQEDHSPTFTLHGSRVLAGRKSSSGRRGRRGRRRRLGRFIRGVVHHF